MSTISTSAASPARATRASSRPSSSSNCRRLASVVSASRLDRSHSASITACSQPGSSGGGSGWPDCSSSFSAPSRRNTASGPQARGVEFEKQMRRQGKRRKVAAQDSSGSRRARSRRRAAPPAHGRRPPRMGGVGYGRNSACRSLRKSKPRSVGRTRARSRSIRPLPLGLVQRRGDGRQRQAGALGELRQLEAVPQPQRVEHELERQLGARHLVVLRHRLAGRAPAPCRARGSR